MVVSKKGSTGNYAANEVMEYNTECGRACNDIVIKSNQDNLVKNFVENLFGWQGRGQGRLNTAPPWRRREVIKGWSKRIIPGVSRRRNWGVKQRG